MRLFNGSRPLFLGIALAVPLLTGANGNGCGPGQVVIGNDTGGGSTASGGVGGTAVCTPAECGPAPAIAKQCPGGSAVVPVCDRDPNGTCGWFIPACDPGGTVCNCPELPAVVEDCPGGTTVSPECVSFGTMCEVVFPACPSAACTTAECGPPLPLPLKLCPDGSQAPVECGANSGGVCTWFNGACPPTKCTPSDCGPEPTLEVDCNGTTVAPVCETDANGTCGWIIPQCPPGGGADAGGGTGGSGACPTPHPQPCNAIEPLRVQRWDAAGGRLRERLHVRRGVLRARQRDSIAARSCSSAHSRSSSHRARARAR